MAAAASFCAILLTSYLYSYIDQLEVSGNPQRRSLRTCSVVRTLRREILVYMEYQSVCPCVGIRSSPLSPPQASVSPALDPMGGGGEQNSLAVEGVGDPIRTTGQKA